MPSEPTVVVGYKNNAMVLVSIGKHIYDYTSVMTIVEGRVLDASPWQAVTTHKAPPPPVPLSQPGYGSTEPTPIPVSRVVPSVPSNQLADQIKQGVVVVQFIQRC